jgi:methionyl-tRNA synthetase
MEMKMGNTTDVKKTETTAETAATVQAAATVTATAQTAPPEQVPAQITFQQFQAVEMLVGEVKAVESIPGADKLVKLFVDFGERGPRTIVAGIAPSLADPPGVNGGGLQKVVGKRYAFVYNLEPRKLRGVESQGMLLAAKSATDPDKVSLVEVPGAKIGARLT